MKFVQIMMLNTNLGEYIEYKVSRKANEKNKHTKTHNNMLNKLAYVDKGANQSFFFTRIRNKNVDKVNPRLEFRTIHKGFNLTNIS